MIIQKITLTKDNKENHHMVKKAKKAAVVKGIALEKNIASSISGLTAAFEAGAKAVESRSADAKKFLAENKRLAKKRAALVKRKKTTTNKIKKDPSNAEAKKVLRGIEKEITDISKQIAKLKPQKDTNAEELAALRSSLKRATAYVKGIEQADKVLNKPIKKKRRRTVTQKAA
jgi:small-conductance mechanosensitive channel